MIGLKYRAFAGIVALAIALAEPSCQPKAGSSDTDNGTGLPDGKVHSRTVKTDGHVEICVRSEATGSVKCKIYTKAEVSGCKKGAYWPDCYHLPIKKAENENPISGYREYRITSRTIERLR